MDVGSTNPQPFAPPHRFSLRPRRAPCGHVGDARRQPDCAETHAFWARSGRFKLPGRLVIWSVALVTYPKVGWRRSVYAVLGLIRKGCVMASEAKPSRRRDAPTTKVPRRFAPRNDPRRTFRIGPCSGTVESRPLPETRNLHLCSTSGTSVSSTRAVESTPGSPAPGCVPAPTR